MHIYKKLKNVRHMVFDVDGVFTNSLLLITEEGEYLRSMNTRDGLAVKLAISAGLDIAIITGGRSKGVALRLQRLGVEKIFSDIGEKDKVFNNLINEHNWQKEHIIFMGDDLPDIKVMKLAGIAACPADAAKEAYSEADWISRYKGGKGCVRELIETVLKLQDKWPV